MKMKHCVVKPLKYQKSWFFTFKKKEKNLKMRKIKKLIKDLNRLSTSDLKIVRKGEIIYFFNNIFFQ